MAIVGRNSDRLNEVAEQIKSADLPTPLTIVADVTKDGQRIVDETIKHFGKLNVLVNNAGISVHDSIYDMDITEFDRVFDTNVRSIMILTQLCVPHLEATKGNIVNISSIASLKPLPGLTGYCTAKAALDQFTKCCALDLAPKSIRVNAINPGVVRTPIFQKTGMTDEAVEKLFEQVKKEYPVGRVGEVSDTSEAIAFLADDKRASFLNGVILPVDGAATIAGVGYRN